MNDMTTNTITAKPITQIEDLKLETAIGKELQEILLACRAANLSEETVNTVMRGFFKEPRPLYSK